MPNQQMVTYYKLGRGGFPVACYDTPVATETWERRVIAHHVTQGYVIRTHFGPRTGVFLTSVKNRQTTVTHTHTTLSYLTACAYHVHELIDAGMVTQPRATFNACCYFQDPRRREDATDGVRPSYTEAIARNMRELIVRDMTLGNATLLWDALLVGVIQPDQFAQHCIDSGCVFVCAAAHVALSHQRRLLNGSAIAMAPPRSLVIDYPDPPTDRAATPLLCAHISLPGEDE